MTLLLFSAPPAPLLPPPDVGPRAGSILARPVFEVAWINGPYDDDPTYVDMAPYLRDDEQISFSRGKQDELAQFDAGDNGVILDPALIGENRRALEPQYPDGKYYPNVMPEKRTRYSLEYPWLPGLLRDFLLQGVGPPWTEGPNTALSLENWSYLLGGSGQPIGKSLAISTLTPGNQSVRSPLIPLVEGQYIAGSVRVQASTGFSRPVLLRVIAFDIDQDEIVSHDSALVLDNGDTWTRVGNTLLGPVDCAYMAFEIEVQDCDDSETHFICAPAFDYTSKQGIFPQITTFADSWDPVWRPAMDAWMKYSGHDGFKLLGGKRITNTGFALAMLSLDPLAYFRLGDPLNSPYAADEVNAEPAFVAGTPVFNIDGALLADINSAMDVTMGYLDAGTNPMWVGAGEVAVTFFFKNTEVGCNWFYQGIDDGSSTAWWVYSGDTFGGGTANDTMTVILINADTTIHALFSFPAPEDNDWHLVTLSRASNGRTWSAYVDGVQVQMAVGTAGVLSGLNFFANDAFSFTGGGTTLVGSADGTVNVDQGNTGVMDEVAFFDHALTLADHIMLYEAARLAWEGQTSGERINAVLDAIGWPVADRDIDTGSQILPAQVTPVSNTNAKTYLQKVEEAEGGQLFMGKDNEVRFVGRQTLSKAPYTDIKAVFGDRPGTIDAATGLPELPYGPAQPRFGDSTYYTEVEVSREVPEGETAAPQLVTDSTMTYNPQRTLQRSGIMLPDDEAAWQYAHWLFTQYRVPVIKFDEITVDPTENDELWQQVLEREITDRVVVIRRPPGWQSGDTFMRIEAIITGIGGNDKRKGVKRSYRLGQVLTTPFIILDDPVYGELDADNYLGL